MLFRSISVTSEFAAEKISLIHGRTWGIASLRTGEIVVKKVDSQTGAALSGARIELADVAGSIPNRIELTDEQGIATFSALPLGEYIVTEIQAPVGYTLDTGNYEEILLTAVNNTSSVVFEDSLAPIVPSTPDPPGNPEPPDNPGTEPEGEPEQPMDPVEPKEPGEVTENPVVPPQQEVDPVVEPAQPELVSPVAETKPPTDKSNPKTGVITIEEGIIFLFSLMVVMIAIRGCLKKKYRGKHYHKKYKH